MNRAPETTDADGGTLEALPGLARIGVGLWMRAVTWSLGTSLRASSRVMRAARTGEPVGALLEDATEELRRTLQDVLGVSMNGHAPEEVAEQAVREAVGDAEQAMAESLREHGARLLSDSADVDPDTGPHRAYRRILSQLVPDEARILRLLILEGAQPSVDVRTWRPLDMGSELVGGGLSMIGAHAGCRCPERVPAYLNNLFRLGLVWFSREPVPELARYQVLEAQPDVLAAMDRAGRARVVRRSIALTPFGEDFCRSCLPLDTGEFEAVSADARRAAEEVAPEAGMPAPPAPPDAPPPPIG